MTVVALDRTSSLRVGATWGLYADPPTGAQTGWRSRTYATLSLGPYDLLAGDIIDVRLDHEFSNANAGQGYWTVNGMKSEHWSAWIMASTCVKLGDTTQLGSPAFPLAGGGSTIMPAQETNWDWFIHHLGISRSSLYRVPADRPDSYIWTQVYFKAGMAYGTPGMTVTIEPGGYPLLTAKIER